MTDRTEAMEHVIHSSMPIDFERRYAMDNLIAQDADLLDAQPTQSDVERVARALAQADRIEICSDATYALSSYGHKAQAALAAMRQPTQSDALLDAEGVKLYWYRQGKDDGVEHERAKIVAWLHEQHDVYNPSDNWSAYWAERIEAGEHLK